MTTASKKGQATKGGKAQAKSAKAPKVARAFPNPGFGFSKKGWAQLAAEGKKANMTLSQIVQHMAKKVYGIDAKAE